jgi:hypothetical protein
MSAWIYLVAGLAIVVIFNVMVVVLLARASRSAGRADTER